MRAIVITMLGLGLVSLLGCGPQAKPPVNPGPAVPAVPSLDDATKGLTDAAKGLTDSAQGAVDDAKKGIDSAAGGVADALKGLEGGPEAIKSVTEFFTKASETLGGIKDAESAKAALPNLEALGLNADTVKAALDKLPAETKTAIAGSIDQGVASLTALADKLKAIPGVEPVIKPHLDALLAKVAAWKA